MSVPKTNGASREFDAIVGISGAAATRCALLTASARTLPLRTICSTEGTLLNAESTCPPTTSVMAGAMPRYGTCRILMPVSALIISPIR